jgi:hypothetical protein
MFSVKFKELKINCIDKLDFFTSICVVPPECGLIEIAVLIETE